MALRAAQETGSDLSPLTWTDADLTADSVTVRWSGAAKPAFVKLAGVGLTGYATACTLSATVPT